jgi:hypothetical protein
LGTPTTVAITFLSLCPSKPGRLALLKIARALHRYAVF